MLMRSLRRSFDFRNFIIGVAFGFFLIYVLARLLGGCASVV